MVHCLLGGPVLIGEMTLITNCASFVSVLFLMQFGLREKKRKKKESKKAQTNWYAQRVKLLPCKLYL